MIGELYNNFIFEPVINLIVFLYNLLPVKDFGIVIILMTALLKAFLLPTEIKNIKSQKAIKKIQPEVEELQKKYKDDQETQAKELMKLYEREKINPFAGFGTLFIQLPILIALYQSFMKFADIFAGKDIEINLYKGIVLPETINHTFMGFMDLSAPSLALAAVVILFQLYQMQAVSGTSFLKPAKTKEEMASKMMGFVFTGMFAIILLRLPAALGLYFFTSLLLSFAAQMLLIKDKQYESGTNQGNNQ